MTLKRSFLFFLLALSAAAFLTRQTWLVHDEMPIKSREKAFLNSEWGMSPNELAAVHGAALTEKTGGRHLYQAEAGTDARYKTLEASGKFLGREAVTNFTFFDDKLVSYHVFVSDSDEHALDEDMKRYLMRAFGAGSEEEDQGTPLKMVWQTKEKIVNYWLYEEPNALSRPYRAGFGVQRLAD
jgi:hypothetical protein